jgi:hypothetical protein
VLGSACVLETRNTTDDGGNYSGVGHVLDMCQSGVKIATLSLARGSDGIIQRRFKESGEPDPVARRLPRDMNEILRLRREGASFTAIGYKFGVCQTTIYDRLKEVDPSLLGFFGPRPNPRTVVEMRDGGMSIRNIALAHL